MTNENYINHIALVIDASSSMLYNGHSAEVVQVADNLISHLAMRSKELDQETRITVYNFADNVTCMIYDKDVLRLPSIKDLYRASGNTALIDATNKSLDDLEKTAQLYGDHAFLVYVLTDGEENASNAGQRRQLTRQEYQRLPGLLKQRLDKLPENWTVAAFVPNQHGVFEAKRFGFPADNISVWDPSDNKGMAEVGRVIRETTDSYFAGRAKGVRGTRTLFSTSVDALNKETVKDANLKPLAKGSYDVLKVNADATIRDFVESQGQTWVKGNAYYQLTKTETIQGYKGIAIRNKKSGRFYTGAQVRDLLGLSDNDERVKPDKNPEYEVFVQSTSVNRRLLAGTKVLWLL